MNNAQLAVVEDGERASLLPSPAPHLSPTGIYYLRWHMLLDVGRPCATSVRRGTDRRFEHLTEREDLSVWSFLKKALLFLCFASSAPLSRTHLPRSSHNFL